MRLDLFESLLANLLHNRPGKGHKFKERDLIASTLQFNYGTNINKSISIPIEYNFLNT